MKSLESRVAPERRAETTYADGETASQRVEVASKEKQAAEKPKMSEEIAIEEINIDGMCGVY